jgi:hypothetical protein
VRWWQGVRLLVLLALAACTRTTEFIGSPPGIWNCGPRCFSDSNLEGLPRPLPALWEGDPDPVAADKPALIYPLAGSVHPIDIGKLTLQWRSGTAMLGYYRVRVTPVRAPDRRYDFYIPCRAPPGPVAPLPDECQYELPARAWAALARDNAGGEVTVTITATRTQPDPKLNFVIASDPVPLGFSPAAVEAGLYYFSEERSGVLRALIGAPAAQPFILPTARFACAGCHAVSRDGSSAAYVYDRLYLGIARTADPAAPTVSPADPPVPDATTVALSPDGSLVAVSQAGLLSVRDAATGRPVGAPLSGLYFPDWSPDGRAIAATQAATAQMPYTVNDASIVVVPWDGAQLGPAHTLVAGDTTQLHFHPAWSPDGAWIAFASAPLPGSSYDNRQARLRLVPSGGGAPIDLDRAGHGSGASWPRFAPASHAGGKVFYLSFDSRLDYGYFARNSVDPKGGHPQLWLSSIDLRRLPGDPSSPPLWLPFQNPTVANVLGAWTERLACGPPSPCGEGTRCESGRCVPLPP